jgi:anti-sigma factor RsiW
MIPYKQVGHVDDLLSDYVLGLLTDVESQRISEHAASCERCRRLILQERDLLQLVRTTLAAASRPSANQLDRLMPATPPGPLPTRLELVGRRSLTLAALTLIILFAGVIMPRWQGAGRPPAYAPTALKTAMIATYTPTLTATLTGAPQLSPSALAQLQTAAPEETAPEIDTPTPVITPNPVPLLQ